MELKVSRARWDTHKLNSTENSIWDQTFPGAISAGIVMYKGRLQRSSQNNPNFKGPHPESGYEKSFRGEPQGHVSVRGFTLQSFFWMLSDWLKMNTGENNTHYLLFSFSLFAMSLHFHDHVMYLTIRRGETLHISKQHLRAVHWWSCNFQTWWLSQLYKEVKDEMSQV